MKVDSSGFGNDDEDHHDALRGGMTISVLSLRQHGVRKEKKEVGVVVVSGGEVMNGTGKPARYTLRDEKGERAGHIVITINPLASDEPEHIEVAPHVALQDGKGKAQGGDSTTASVDEVKVDEKPFDPFAPTPEQDAAASELREKMKKITCPLCNQVYMDPVILGNCRHAMCRRCVWRAVGDGVKKLMECPSCGVSYNLGFAGTKGLTVARHVHPELRDAGFAQNTSKTDPERESQMMMGMQQPGMMMQPGGVVPPQMSPQQMAMMQQQMQMTPQQMAMMQQQMQQMSFQQQSQQPQPQSGAANPFGEPQPAASAPAADDVWSRLNAKASVHAQQRQMEEMQRRSAQGAASNVVAQEFSGMGAGYIKD
jgi:Zinc finger, C3HC4 type (RING finger)